MKKSFRSALAVLLLLLWAAGGAFAAETTPVEITILHVNDTHGHLQPFVDKLVRPSPPVGGMGYLAARIERERAGDPDGTLLLSAGDMFQGTPLSNILHGKPVIEIMNRLGFDAMTIGNHEFDWSIPTLIEMKSEAKFPFLSSNIVDAVTGKRPDYATPYIFLTRKGIKIAVIGLTTPETSYTTKPTNVQGLRFEQPETVLPPIIKDVKKLGAQLVVVLSHIGLDDDEALARKVQGIDVIVGGHSHTVVPNPIRVGDTLVVQAGYYGVYLGTLKLKVDPAAKKWVEYNQGEELAVISAGPMDASDPDIDSIIAHYAEQSRAHFSKVVGSTTVDLMRNPTAESNVGDLVADAMRESSHTEIAFMNSGGLRIDIPAGDIDLEKVYTLLPFDNLLVSMDLTGEQVKKVLEQSAQSSRGLLQTSGLRFRIVRNSAEGNHVRDLTVNGAPIQMDKTYRVVTNDFLAVGGDQFTIFQEGKNLAYGDVLRDSLAHYLEKHSPVSPRVDCRVTIE